METRPEKTCRTTQPFQLDFHNLTPRQADFMQCLLASLFAALPTFIEALLSCLAGSGGGLADTYDPGDRNRC